MKMISFFIDGILYRWALKYCITKLRKSFEATTNHVEFVNAKNDDYLTIIPRAQMGYES